MHRNRNPLLRHIAIIFITTFASATCANGSEIFLKCTMRGTFFSEKVDGQTMILRINTDSNKWCFYVIENKTYCELNNKIYSIGELKYKLYDQVGENGYNSFELDRSNGKYEFVMGGRNKEFVNQTGFCARMENPVKPVVKF